MNLDLMQDIIKEIKESRKQKSFNGFEASLTKNKLTDDIEKRQKESNATSNTDSLKLEAQFDIDELKNKNSQEISKGFVMSPNKMPQGMMQAFSQRPNQMPTTNTFEDGARKMAAKLEVHDPKAYFANKADPLHAAFTAKAIVHSGPSGIPLFGQSATQKIDEIYDTPRSGTGLAYIHIPFCESRCLYCMFYLNPFKLEVSRAYTKALIKELQMWSDRSGQNSAPINALYFGGGTPTALAPDDLISIMHAVKKYLPLANDCEITLEGRIHNFTDEKMEAAIASGINRFSIGIQTFNSKIRQSMRRVDSRDTIFKRLDKLISYNQASVVIDLIYGFPGQTLDIWADDVKTASELPLDGIDCYQLNFFEKSPLARFVANGKLPYPANTAMKADMFAMSVEMLSNTQWRRLSNNHWGNGFRERNIYNTLGKSACDCLAFGCGAGGRIHGFSYMLERKLENYYKLLEDGVKPIGMMLAPKKNWKLLKTISSNMELGSINLTKLGREFNLPLAQIASELLTQWTDAGLLKQVGDNYIQTVAGQFWHVTLAQLLVNWISNSLQTP